MERSEDSSKKNMSLCDSLEGLRACVSRFTLTGFMIDLSNSTVIVVADLFSCHKKNAILAAIHNIGLSSDDVVPLMDTMKVWNTWQGILWACRE